MQAEGLRPGGAAYVAAMAACARGGVVERALELLDRVLVEHPGDETARRRSCLLALSFNCREPKHLFSANTWRRDYHKMSLACLPPASGLCRHSVFQGCALYKTAIFFVYDAFVAGTKQVRDSATPSVAAPPCRDFFPLM